MQEGIRRVAPWMVLVALVASLAIAVLAVRHETPGDMGAATKPSDPGGVPLDTPVPTADRTPTGALGATVGPSITLSPTPERLATAKPTPARSASPTRLSPTPRPTPTRSPISTRPPPTPKPSPKPTPTSAKPFVLVGAGDIASCSSNGDEATATVLDQVGGTVFTTGDNAYNDGTATEFRDCYGPSWGRSSIKSRTRPVPGNHDYNTPGATGYFGYFGSAAGDPAKGYYAYAAGTWRVYVLNSNCAAIGGCGAGSAQERWLRNDLEAHPASCVVAMWHHSRFSSGGEHGSSAATQALYQALYDFNAELVLTGHDHDYERFAPQTATGALDNDRGIVQIVVGTGGKSHYAWGPIQPNSLVRNNDAYGVLRLALSAGSWSFDFLPVAGQTFRDSGTGTCH